MKKLVLILVSLTGFCANAITIVKVEGVVTSMTSVENYYFDDSVQAGTTFTEYYYFADTTDRNNDSQRGDYLGEYATLSIGNYLFNFSSSEMNVLCYYPTDNCIWVTAGGSESDGLIYIDSIPYEYDSIDWALNYTRATLSSYSEIPTSDEFPNPFLDLSLFDKNNYWNFSSFTGDRVTTWEGIILYGDITSISVIPEPCSLVLLGLGGLAVMRRRRLG
jgi:hypothetical protein